MYNRDLIAKIILLQRLRKRIARKKRSIYIRPIFLRRNLQGDSVLVTELRADPEYHFKYFRMDKNNFDAIFNRVDEKLFHSRTHVRPISSLDRLAITLRYLATGNSQISLALNYRISPSSVNTILRETMKAICDKFCSEYLQNPTEKSWTENEKEFTSKWNYPNACGAIDGKHIQIKAPAASGSSFYNYKNFSIVLLAISNANYMFTAVDIGHTGSESDGGILMRSDIGKRLKNNTFKMPNPKSVSSSGELIPQVILGDSGFPLIPYLMTPYKGQFIPKENRIFNYRLSRARMVVENSFGILGARWRIFLTLIDADVELIRLITRTCVILHNFLLSKKDFNSMTVDRLENGILVPGSWREITANDTGMSSFANQGTSDNICFSFVLE